MKKRLLSFSLVIAMLFTFFNFPTSAQEIRENLEASFSLSKEAVKPGETVTVSFNLDNYSDTAVPGIKAFDGHIKVDESLGTLQNVQSAMVTNSGDSFDTNIGQDGTLNLFYESSWSTPMTLDENTTETKGSDSYYILPRDNTTLFTFDLVVNQSITADELKHSLFETMEFTFSDADGEEIITDYSVPTLDVLAEDPQILLNGKPVEETTYTEMVTVSADKGTVVLKDKDGAVIQDNIAKEDGTYTVTATDAAGNQSTATFTVKLAAKSLEVITKPTKVQYYAGDALDLTGGMLRVTYANEAVYKDVPMTADSVKVSGYDANVVGKQNLTISYTEDGKTVTTVMEVEVLKNEVDQISWNTKPSNTTYIEGQDLDLTGAKIHVIYQNGTEEDVDVTSNMISGYDKDEVGNQEVTVTYGEKTLTFTVTVKAKSVTGITAVLTNPQQKIGMAFDEKGTVTVSYDNNTTEEISFDDEKVTLSYPDDMMDSLGEKHITVSYAGKDTEVTLTVIDKVLIGIDVTAPNKTTYIEGQKLDVTGGKITLQYDNNTTAEIALTEAECSVVSLDKPGTQTITVTYGGFTDTFTVTVNEKSISNIEWNEQPTKTEFKEREEFSVDGSLLISYDNGTTEVVPVTADMVTGFHSEQPGNQILTVTYPGCDQELNYTITVVKKQLVSLSVTKLPNVVEYLQNDNGDLDLTGMEVYGHYDNGYDYLIDNSQITVSGYDLSQPGVQNVVVSYEGIDAQQVFTVTVVSREAVDTLDAQISEVDVDALTVEDEQTVLDLLSAYNNLSQVEKDGLLNYNQLKAMEAQMNKLVKPQREESFDDFGWSIFISSGTIRYDVSFDASKVEVSEDVLAEIRSQLGDLSKVLSAMQFTVNSNQKAVQYLPSPATLRYALGDTDSADQLRVMGQTADGTLSVISSRLEGENLVFTADEKYEAYYVVLAEKSVPPTSDNDQQGSTNDDNTTSNTDKESGSQNPAPDTSDPFFGLAVILLAVSGVMALVLVRRKYDA